MRQHLFAVQSCTILQVLYNLCGWLPAPQVVKRWRVWAPVKHAQRRRLRDAVMTLHRNTRRRVWTCMREYTAKRRLVRAAKQRAFQHFRCVGGLDSQLTKACMHDFYLCCCSSNARHIWACDWQPTSIGSIK